MDLLDADCFESISQEFTQPNLNNPKQSYVPKMAVFTIMEADDSEEEDY
jgi:hypothetical protein